ncbi:MAG: Protein translocase subunit SecF [Parcubacteria group bacterium GW2011_GWA2_40_14]|nr:MAG: Protein translocase subunit SecF [Parcubacteria group bacterium GW2011_GWA2_40_14]
MFIINHRKFFFVLSTFLVVGSIVVVSFFGFNFGIDFKGGSILEVSYVTERPTLETIKAELDKLNLGAYILTPSGNTNYILKTRDLTQAEKTVVLKTLSPMLGLGINLAKEERFNSIGPVVGSQLKNKAIIAIIIVIICIVLFITFAFRKVSQPVASWKYGLATIVALAHDVIIPTGVFVLWSHFHGGEIDLLFVTALLAILGYSVHDTIVVFDRVRENLHLEARPPSGGFEQTVGASVSQTFGRSINTSLTIFLALISLYFLGGSSTKDFAFVLLIGIIAGTYSSIFVASPLLVTLEKLQKK